MRLLYALLALTAALALGVLFWPSRTVEDPARPRPQPTPQEPTPPAPSPEPDAPAAEAPSPEPAPEARDEPPPPDLLAAVLAADREAKTDAEVLEARRLLAAILRKDPAAARVLAEALGAIRSRALGFQLSRLLGAHLRDPAVRARVLALIAEGEEVPQEMALYTVLGLEDDPAVAVEVAAVFARDGRDRSRTAAACCLVEMLPALDAGDRDRVRRTARTLVASPATEAQLRVEAIGLLDPGADAGDRAQLEGLLHAGPHPPPLRLAAARALLTSGTPLDEVRPALADIAAGQGPEARALEAILEELGDAP